MPIRDFIVKIIQKNDKPILKLDNCSFRDYDIEELVSLVNANPKITTLSLSHNGIEDDGAKMLMSLKYVNDLNVSRNNLGNIGAIALVSQPNFIRLDLSKNGNVIDDVAGQFMLEKAHQIVLNVDENDISNSYKEKISERIQKNWISYIEKFDKHGGTSKAEEKPIVSSPSFFSSQAEIKVENTDLLIEKKNAPS